MPRFKNLPAGGVEQTALQTLRNDVTTYLATEVLLHFTDHGIGHSDRMVDIISKLIQPIQSGTTALSPQELTTLYATCYLHDLGMHVEKLSGLTSVPQNWSELPKKTQENLIRDKHHTISAELVVRASQKSGPCSALHLKDLHPDQVACLCEAHNLWLEEPADNARYIELTRDAVGMRMGFLAALLRLADVLDESQARAGIDKARILDLDKESLKHWWRHYFTEHITILQADRTITLEFNFPKDKAEEYGSIIPELQYPYITAEMQRHTAVLTKNNCTWQINKATSSTPYSTKEEMPQDVKLSMLADLQHSRIEREERGRIAALADFREARPAIERELQQLSEKKTRLTPVEYITAALELHRRLWISGGKRSAFSSFECIFRGTKESLPDNIRLSCACQLSSWGRECGLALVSAQKLKGLLPLTDRLTAKDPMRFIFYCELFQNLYDLGIHYIDACSAAEAALSAASTNEQKLGVIVELAEMSYLLAEPRAALAVLQEYENLFKTVRTNEALRCRLLYWRLTVMTGKSADGIAAIDAFTKEFSCWKGNSAVIQCLLLKGEVLRLMGDLPAANAVFRDQLWENVQSLPLTESIIIASCYQDVVLNAFERSPLIDWTTHVDERITAGVEFEDAEHALSGLDSAAAGKHYDAMADLLKAVRNMYKSGSWPALSNAYGRLALESVAIGSVHDAAFYCVLGSSKERRKEVAKAFINCTNADEFSRAITTLLEFSHLPLHAQCACELLEMIGDEIPDAIMPSVVQYLLKCTDIRTEGGFSTTTVSEAAWTALETVVDRIDCSVAQKVANKILAIDLPSQKILLRRKLTPVLTRLIPKLDSAQIDSLAETTVSMLTDYKNDIDFREAFDLLAEIAPLASRDVRARIRDCMYPGGSCNGNGLLLQTANLFNITPTFEELSSVARWLLQRLVSEVLVLDPDAEVPKQRSGSFERIVNDKRIVTYDMPVAVIWGLTRHINRIGAQFGSELLNALLLNLQNTEDSIANKCSILSVLPLFLNVCDDSGRIEAIKIIFDIASAEPVAPTGTQTEEEANHPLQRFRIHAGSPEQVRGSAIQCLTQIANDHPKNCSSGDLQRILEAGVASAAEDIRRASFLAAQSNVTLSHRTLMQMLIGTRDESPIAAAAAFYVFANNTSIAVGPFAELLCYTLRYAVRNEVKSLRLASAKLLARLEQEQLEPAVAQEVTNLANGLRKDRSWRVRQAVNSKVKGAKGDIGS